MYYYRLTWSWEDWGREYWGNTVCYCRLTWSWEVWGREYWGNTVLLQTYLELGGLGERVLG